MSSRHRALDHFGQNIRKHRTEKGLSQEALAEKADLDPTYISGIERGVRLRHFQTCELPRPPSMDLSVNWI
jgi:transcriptional regulator with XRE-family HTH domain